MPIYEYQCEKCQHHVEALQKFSDKPLRDCPECGKRSLKRLISAPMFRLAGSGWYETDFKSDNEQKRNLAGKEEAPAVEASADKTTTTDKADSKPESKAEAKPEGKPAPKPEPVSATKSASKSATKPIARAKPAAKKSPAKKSVRRR